VRRAVLASAALALLVALGAALRLVGIGYLLPEVMNRDGMVLHRQVEILRGGPATPENDPWHYGFYPHLTARIAALLPEERSKPEGPTDLARHLELASAPWIRLRVVSALLSLLAIPATYLLGRRFLERGPALFAAALVATSLHDIVLAVQEKPHAAAASFIAIALLAATRLRRRPDVLGYLLAGIAAGLALGTLQSGAACLFAVGAAFLLREKKEGAPAPAAWIAATVALVALAFRAFYPFFFRPQPAIVSTGSTTSAGGFAQMIAQGVGGARVGKILAAAFGLDPLPVAAAALGILIWAIGVARSKEARTASLRGELPVLLAFLVPYLAVLVSFRETLVRFCLPLVPLLAIAAGFAFQRATSRMRASAAIALAAALLAIPLLPAVHFARIRTRPSPLDEAARWVEANVPRDETVVVVPHYDLPLLLTDQAIEANTRDPEETVWSQYLSGVPRETLVGDRRSVLVEPGERPRSRFDLRDDPVGYLRSVGARTIVLDLSGWPSGMLKGKLDLATRISPCAEDDGKRRGIVLWGTGYDPLRPSAASILGLRSVGTAVEIYRLP
jgi:hypothetical protein